MKRILYLFVVLFFVLCNFGTFVYAENKVELNGFKDVPKSHWAYKYIMDISDKGLMSGTTSIDSNGIGTFEPDRFMTRAEFLAPLVRYIFGNDLVEKTNINDKWWKDIYDKAIEYGFLESRDFNGGMLDTIINRQEAAQLICWALNINGDIPPSLVSTDKIADYNKLSVEYTTNSVIHYSGYVRFVYSMGVMGGIDNNGTFDGLAKLTRAQAATILYRFVNKEERENVELYKPDKSLTEWYKAYNIYENWNDYDSWTQNINYSLAIDEAEDIDSNYLIFTRSGEPYDKRIGIACTQEIGKVDYVPKTNQMWVEGDVHSIPQVGDIVIKDGKKIVLKLNHGILGFGQGVDIYTGININGYIIDENSFSCFNERPLSFDPITGEMHSIDEWNVIKIACVPSTYGKYDGEIRNNWFVWDSAVEAWLWCGPH